VALCWGFTNPFIRRGAQLSDTSPPDNSLLAEFLVLFTRWQYVLPLAINLCGSVVFYYTLSNSDLTLVAPISNGLTFVFTFIAGYLLGEQTPTKGMAIGASMVAAGLAICLQS